MMSNERPVASAPMEEISHDAHEIEDDIQQIKGHAKNIEVFHQRYLVNEVHPVRFGPIEESLVTIFTVAFVVGLGHLSFFTCSRLMAERTIVDGTTVADLWSRYSNSNQFLVGLLLNVWITGYNVVSWFIYRQFERHEVYPADDFYMSKKEPEMSETDNAAGQMPPMGHLHPAVISLPDGTLALGIQAC